MSVEEAKKLIEDGLRNLQEGFTKLFEAIENLEGDEEPDTGLRPVSDLAKQLCESVKKKK